MSNINGNIIKVNGKTREATGIGERFKSDCKCYEADAVTRREAMRPGGVSDTLVLVMMNSNSLEALSVDSMNEQLDACEVAGPIKPLKVIVDGREPLLSPMVMHDLLASVKARYGETRVTIRTRLELDDWSYAQAVGDLRATRDIHKSVTVECTFDDVSASIDKRTVNRIHELDSLGIGVEARLTMNASTKGADVYQAAVALKGVVPQARLVVAFDKGSGASATTCVVEDVAAHVEALIRNRHDVETDAGRRMDMFGTNRVLALGRPFSQVACDPKGEHCGAFTGRWALTPDGTHACETLYKARIHATADAWAMKLYDTRCASCEISGVCKGGCVAQKISDPAAMSAYCAWNKACIRIEMLRFEARAALQGIEAREILRMIAK